MEASNYDKAMSDAVEYVDPDAAAEAMYAEAAKSDAERQEAAKVEDKAQEVVEDKPEDQPEEEAEDQEEVESKAGDEDEEEESEFDDKDPKRVRIGKWSDVDRRAASITAKTGIPLEKALAIAKDELGVTDESEEEAAPEIPDTVVQIRTTLEAKKAELATIEKKLDESDEDYELTAKDLRKLTKQESDLKLEILRLEHQEERETENFERRQTEAERFASSWDTSVLRGLEEFPEADKEDSRLSDAMHVAMDKFSSDPNHKYKGNPDAPYLILRDTAARLGIKSAKESQSADKGDEQAKATQKPAQKAGYRPASGKAATADKSTQSEGLTQEALAKAVQEGGPEAAAEMLERHIYKQNAQKTGLGFAIA